MSEIISTCINEVQNSNIKNICLALRIVIKGVIEGQMVTIFGIDGKQLVSQVSAGEPIKLRLKDNCAYIKSRL